MNKLRVFILTNGCGSYIDDSLQLHNPLLSLLVAVTLQKKQTPPFEQTYGLKYLSTWMTHALLFRDDVFTGP